METPTLDFAGLEALAQTLSAGFEALMAEVSRQRRIETALRDRLQFAADEYSILAQITSPSDSVPINARDMVKELCQNVLVDEEAMKNLPVEFSVPSNPAIEDARQACRTLKRKTKKDAPLRLRRCPVTNHTTDQEDFEHDFTTSGKQGGLECPFAKMTHQNDGIPHTPTSTLDPIAAEFHQDKVSVRSATASAPTGSKCPIRFLDQHSPEEVAKYFENHKHEIPRSHEVCVKRYQQNEQSIRQLDAKYGNLVNMIQGLGVKHKQYLPEKDKETEEAENEEGLREHGQGPKRAVEHWTEDVSEKSDVVAGVDGADQDARRTGHFERPLREIRVGESPSRPWGISVPPDEEAAESATASEAGGQIEPSRDGVAFLQHPPRPVDPRTAPTKCPFSHGTLPKKTGPTTDKSKGITKGKGDAKPVPAVETAKGPDMERTAGEGATSPSNRPQIVFNGPVFFGYSAEQAAAFLEALKNLDGPGLGVVPNT